MASNEARGSRMYRNLLTELLLLCIIKIRKWILPACANGRQVKSGKKDKRKKVEKPAEDWEKELNIKYHDVNPQWNYTIYPRSGSKQVKKDKKRKDKK